jgi:hypothetical protein
MQTCNCSSCSRGRDKNLILGWLDPVWICLGLRGHLLPGAVDFRHSNIHVADGVLAARCFPVGNHHPLESCHFGRTLQSRARGPHLARSHRRQADSVTRYLKHCFVASCLDCVTFHDNELNMGTEGHQPSHVQLMLTCGRTPTSISRGIAIHHAASPDCTRSGGLWRSAAHHQSRDRQKQTPLGPA